MWASAEYLLWWLKDSPDPVPLLTGTPLGSTAAFPGALGNPDTSVLLGGHSVDTEEHSGARFTLGYWLDDQAIFGVEAQYFFLGIKTSNQSINENGAPSSLPTFIPYFSTQFGAEVAAAVNSPGTFVGFSTLSISEQLQGAELNGVANLGSGAGWRLDLLGGFRYWQLDEGLSFTNISPGLSGINAGGSFDTFDNFFTHDQFWGGQIGARAEYRLGNLFVNATGKVALGDMHEVVNIGGGNVTTFVANMPVVSAGGAFAQPSNIGHTIHDRFAVLPEGDLNVGYQYRFLRAFVGYTFQYASDVVRPGDQIDHVINPTQSPVLSGSPGVLIGPSRPAVPFNTSDFWAQGLNFGLELRF
jgi:hypothetical protein